MSGFEKFKLAARALRGAIPALQTGRSVDPAAEEARRLLQNGSFSEAEESLAEVIRELKSRSAIRSGHARILLALATAQWKQRKLDEALETAETARDLLENKESTDMAECLDLLAEVHLAREDAERAEQALAEALELTRDLKGKDRNRDRQGVIQRMRRLATVQRERERLEEASRTLREAVELAESDDNREEHESLAECLIELGQCESARGEHEAAIEALDRALDLLRNRFGPDSEDVARALQALATAHHAAGNLETAIRFYEEALRLRERQLGVNATDFASALMNLAAAHSMLGHYGPAMELFQQAVGKLEPQKDERLASALEGLGTVYYYSGRFDDALTCVRRARTIWDRSPERNRSSIQANEVLLGEMLEYLEAPTAAAGQGSGADAERSRILALDPGGSAGLQPVFRPIRYSRAAGGGSAAAFGPGEVLFVPSRLPTVQPTASAGAVDDLQAQAEAMAGFTAEGGPVPFSEAPVPYPEPGAFIAAPFGMPAGAVIVGAHAAAYPGQAGQASAPIQGAQGISGGMMPQAGAVAFGAPPATYPGQAGHAPIPTRPAPYLAEEARTPDAPRLSAGSPAGPAPAIQGPVNDVPAPKREEAVSISFIRPDGSPVEPSASPGGNLHLTVVLPRTGDAVFVGDEPTPPLEAGQLCGWDELEFEFLPTAQTG
ncbi:MAG: tetratricopeptide repeat protein [Bryobacteraceae bacterium]